MAASVRRTIPLLSKLCPGEHKNPPEQCRVVLLVARGRFASIKLYVCIILYSIEYRRL